MWGMEWLEKMYGDWSVSILDCRYRYLVLARDYGGFRHLYYYPKEQSVIWCSNLAALILLAGGRLTLNDEYIAGFLASWPGAHLTPYQEIHAVSPGKFVRVCDGQTTIHSYWSFDTKRLTRYNTDAEYEEHFRPVFRQAVRRR